MNLAALLALCVLVLPASDKHDSKVIQKSLNQSVEIQLPDAQRIDNLKILAGGKTDNGYYLYVCEGNLVWSIDRQEYLEQYEKAMKTEPFGELGLQFAKNSTPRFKKGDFVARVRMRVRFEEAGGDLIAISAKAIRFDLGITSARDKQALADK